MKITAILENTTNRDDMQVEHGLSLYIEANGKKILFDMGQTDLFYKNAKALGIDLSAVDFAVLSHGHYDHGGGLRKFLEINRTAPIYVNRDAFLPHYNGKEKYIGLDLSLSDNPRIIFTDEKYTVDTGLELFSSSRIEINHSPLDSGLTEKIGDNFIQDDFRHEQYLLIKENKKSILISGCSHKGILDITAHFKPDALVGGFHYSKLPLGDFLVNAAKELASYKTDFYTCHCTGYEQFEFMSDYLPSLRYLSCGESILLD